MSSRPNKTFADETSTGKLRNDLRGLGSIIIAAQCAANDDFEWLKGFRQDYFPGQLEVKSEAVLALVAQNGQASTRLLAHISDSTIAIIDLAHHTRDLLSSLMTVVGMDAKGIQTAGQFIRSGRLPPELAEEMLSLARIGAIENSAIPRVEMLLQQAGERASVPMGRDNELFDRNALGELNNQELGELVTRFTLALGEVLDPCFQAEVIEHKLIGVGFVDQGQIAYAYLQESVMPDRFFDVGTRRAFELLTDAHDRIVDSLSIWSVSKKRIEAGRVAQDDSRKILGLQAADIAAGYARDLFERSESDTRDGANAVRSVFAKVILNDEWIR